MRKKLRGCTKSGSEDGNLGEDENDSNIQSIDTNERAG
jgi:hypothetical protein